MVNQEEFNFHLIIRDNCNDLNTSFSLYLHRVGLNRHIQPEYVLGEVVIRLHDAVVEKNQKISNPVAWLRSTGFHYICELSRENRKTNSLSSYCDFDNDNVATESGSLNILELEEYKELLLRVTSNLRLEDQVILKLRYFEDLSWRRIATILNTSLIRILLLFVNVSSFWDSYCGIKLHQFLLVKEVTEVNVTEVNIVTEATARQKGNRALQKLREAYLKALKEDKLPPY